LSILPVLSYKARKARQEEPVNVRDYIKILRLHSEHLRTLCLQLETTMGQVEQTEPRLEQLEQAMTGEEALMDPETSALLEGIAEVSTNISMTADVLQKRLVALLERTKGEE
jgi:hypothetical protein